MEALAPACPEDCAPGIPADADAPVGSELEDEVPVEVEVRGAEPGVALGVPALGVLPEPLDEEDDEDDGDEEGDEEDPDEPPDEGIPPEEEPPDVAQPAVASKAAAAAMTAARCRGAVTRTANRFMAIAPSGTSASRPENQQQGPIYRTCRSSLSFSS